MVKVIPAAQKRTKLPKKYRNLETIRISLPPKPAHLKGTLVAYGARLPWDEIQIGQAFYFTGGYGFGVKVSKTSFFVMDSDQRWPTLQNTTYSTNCLAWYNTNFFKIPPSIASCLEAVR